MSEGLPEPPTLTLAQCPHFFEAIESLVDYGLPHFNRLLSAIVKHEAQLPKEAKIIIFKMVGSYALNFGKFFDAAKQNETHDLLTIHSMTMNEVLGDPIVAGLVQGYISTMTNNSIHGFVRGD